MYKLLSYYLGTKEQGKITFIKVKVINIEVKQNTKGKTSHKHYANEISIVKST